MTGTRILVLGGARSGKSAWAEQRLADAGVVTYVATSRRDPEDPEWEARVALHRARRPAAWRTEETLDIAAVLKEASDSPVLVDCLAVWLTRMLDDVRAWEECAGWEESLHAKVDDLLEALRRTTRDVVLVSNEVGLGVVPETRAGRLFRDELGRLNARVAAVVDEVWLSVAGITRRWD